MVPMGPQARERPVALCLESVSRWAGAHWKDLVPEKPPWLAHCAAYGPHHSCPFVELRASPLPASVPGRATCPGLLPTHQPPGAHWEQGQGSGGVGVRARW